ncbi:LysR family transcriptional regulator [Pseudochrobactrum sp. Wa41.01b-1]|uniref:LysR family transcriptional regulator n=1 Tax=Pseudochrobactrum sp. Wa41.01b-1 TaxID=2864102 RepID=UPI001C69313C|nr:LysR family transcriptional regulator [Pseudochrobactrum sp. Wa41.01b-1]QYM73228.1 LysR family transcriptional regulator [Pseudochrobactrum sp. Wa41.01b-1]
MLDRQHLTILREVDRLGSLTAAAERMNVTQPALSHLIRKLEERHGIKIWMKHGRNLRLTQAGEYLLALAQRVLPQIEQGERVLADYASGRRGVLRVGMECHPCQKWLMRVTAPYLTAWPDVEFELRTGFPLNGINALVNYEIDVLITPDPIELPGLRYTPVFGYELVLAVHADHRLATQRIALPDDLTDEELITYPVSFERLDIYTQFLVPGHCRPRRHRTAETTELMLQLVAAKRGVSVVPDWLLREEGAELPLKSIRLGPKGIMKNIHLGVRDGEEKIDYLAGFLDMARGREVQAEV